MSDEKLMHNKGWYRRWNRLNAPNRLLFRKQAYHSITYSRSYTRRSHEINREAVQPVMTSDDPYLFEEGMLLKWRRCRTMG